VKKSRFTDEQIIEFLKQAEGGVPVKELCRKNGFSDATFYKWRGRLGGMEVSEARRLRELEGENTKLKKLLAEAMLDIEALKVVARGNGRPAGSKRGGTSNAGQDKDVGATRLCADGPVTHGVALHAVRTASQ
jgi:putative transposase